jgi:hypothetical protein
LGTGRRPRAGQTPSRILSASRPGVNGLPARVDVRNLTERAERLAGLGGGCGSLYAYDISVRGLVEFLTGRGIKAEKTHDGYDFPDLCLNTFNSDLAVRG